MVDNEQKQDSDIAKVIGVKKALISEILRDENSILSKDIYEKYKQGVSQGDTRQVLYLAEIAEELIPESFIKSETIAREVVSTVGFEMNRREVMKSLQPASFTSEEDRVECATQMAQEFHNSRNTQIMQRVADEIPDEVHVKTLKKAREAQGYNYYDELFIRRFAELENLLKHPEGSRHAGIADMATIAVLLSQEHGVKVSASKLNDLKRKNPYYKKLREENP